MRTGPTSLRAWTFGNQVRHLFLMHLKAEHTVVLITHIQSHPYEYEFRLRYNIYPNNKIKLTLRLSYTTSCGVTYTT